MSNSGRPSAAAVATGDLQIVSTSSDKTAISALPPRHPNNSSTALVEYTAPVPNQEEEDLEVKLRRILDCVPVRVNNTSGSSAGSGSGDFHQYRQMRRKEQDRLARMDVDFKKRKQLAEFNKRREERLKAAEERTAKKRLKRQKKKQKKQEKKTKVEAAGDNEQQKEVKSSEEDQDSARISPNSQFPSPSPSSSSCLTRIGTTFICGSPLVIDGTHSNKALVRKATSFCIRCEQSGKDGNGLDVWLGRTAMVGFAVAISVEISTGKGLLENFGLTAPLPTVALAVTALVGVLTAIFIFQSASEN